MQLFAVTERCAKLYEHSYFNGGAYNVSETDSESYLANYFSSIRVRNGCTFKAYKYANSEELLFVATDDMENFGIFDGQISSYSCHCEPGTVWFILSVIFWLRQEQM